MSEDVTIRAARAQQLLEDEVFNEALNAIVADAVNAGLYHTDLNNPTQCVAAIAAFQAASAFQSKLKEYIMSGKAAERKPHVVA